MNEFDHAVQLARKLLDEPNVDPDDDLCLLSRQFLRACEKLDKDANAQLLKHAGEAAEEYRLKYLQSLKDIESLNTEKQRRFYYQNIVYAVCNALDELDKKRPGTGIVCGTFETPTTQVQDRMCKLIEALRS